MQIDWWTLIIQGINFLVLAWLLTRLLYKPVKKVIAKRQELAEQVVFDASQKAKAAEAARLALENARSDLAAERQDLVAQLHTEMATEKQTVLEAAQKKSTEMLDAARRSIANERAKAILASKEQIVELAAGLAMKILSKTGKGVAGAAAFHQVQQYFATLPQDKRAELGQSLEKPETPISLITATPLSKQEQAIWANGLQDWLAADAAPAFTVDAQILGGVILRFPHADLDFSWARALNEAALDLVDFAHGD